MQGQLCPLVGTMTALGLRNVPGGANILLREDGSGGFLLEDGSGVLLMEDEPWFLNLANYWKMEESSGSRLDSVGTKHLSTVTGSVSQVSGKNNFAAAGGLSASSLRTPSNFSQYPGAFSYQFWVKFNSVSGVQTFFQLPPGPGPEGRSIRRTGTALTLIGSGSLTGASGAISAATYHHMAYTYDGSTTWKLYVDGVLYRTKADVATSAVELLLTTGDVTTDGIHWDEVARFSVLLSPTQVAELYNSGAGRFL